MRRVAPLLALGLAACVPRVATTPSRPALVEEGEILIYLDRLPDEAARLSLWFGAVAAVRTDGAVEPLELALPELPAGDAPRQRLLATGRLPAGAYASIELQLKRATLAGEDGPADLLVPKEPARVPLRLQVHRGRATLVRVGLSPGEALEGGFDVGALFSAAALAPSATLPQLAGFASVGEAAGLALFDRHKREVSAFVPTGREPAGLALDAANGRLYVALPREDRVQVLDLNTGDELRQLPLNAGDGPAELALAQAGGLLLVMNAGSDSVVFLDPLSGRILDRVAVGMDPAALLLDQSGRRAYVLDRRSNDLAVLDVANHALASRVGTDAEPLRAALDRTAGRLFVVHRGSAYMAVYSLPDLAQVNRVFVGLGVATVRVDPRTNLVYIGRGDEGIIQVFDPAATLPSAQIEVDGPVSWLALDAVENQLVAAVPSLGRLVFVDLTTRRQVAALDLGGVPAQVVLPGERF